MKFKTTSSSSFFESNDNLNSYHEYVSHFDIYSDYLKKEKLYHDEFSNNDKNTLSFQSSINEELNEISFNDLNDKEDYSFDLDISSINQEDTKEFQQYSENEIPKDNEASASKEALYTETEKLAYDIFILPLFCPKLIIRKKYIYKSRTKSKTHKKIISIKKNVIKKRFFNKFKYKYLSFNFSYKKTSFIFLYSKIKKIRSFITESKINSIIRCWSETIKAILNNIILNYSQRFNLINNYSKKNRIFLEKIVNLIKNEIYFKELLNEEYFI